jgi:transposase-like protein
MKKIVFGLLACVTLFVVSCETNDIAEEDAVYEQGVDKTKIPSQADKKSFVDKTKIPSQADKQSFVDKTKIPSQAEKKN